MASDGESGNDALLDRLRAEAAERGLSVEEYVVDIIERRHNGTPDEDRRELHDRLAEKETQVEELESTLAQRSRRVVDLQETVRELRDRLDGREEEVERLQESLAEPKRRVQELEDEVARLSDRLDSREERIDQLESQLVRRSQVEDKVDELAIQVRERSRQTDAPFIVRWWR